MSQTTSIRRCFVFLAFAIPAEATCALLPQAQVAEDALDHVAVVRSRSSSSVRSATRWGRTTLGHLRASSYRIRSLKLPPPGRQYSTVRYGLFQPFLLKNIRTK